jgi:GDPmannose 4,6-dehydratase
MKKALITGITGQDGSFLAEHLVELGYEVWGIVRRSSSSSSVDRINSLTKGAVNIRYGENFSAVRHRHRTKTP